MLTKKNVFAPKMSSLSIVLSFVDCHADIESVKLEAQEFHFVLLHRSTQLLYVTPVYTTLVLSMGLLASSNTGLVLKIFLSGSLGSHPIK